LSGRTGKSQLQTSSEHQHFRDNYRTARSGIEVVIDMPQRRDNQNRILVFLPLRPTMAQICPSIKDIYFSVFRGDDRWLRSFPNVLKYLQGYM